MKKNNPSKLHRQFLRQSPETILYFVDHYEEVIKKYLHKSYKGRLEEKWKDLEALYNARFKEDALKRPLHQPSLKDLKYMSKRTLAVLFFSTAHDLRFTEIKHLDSYWRKRREAKEEILACKKMSRKEYKEKYALAMEYYEMVRKSRKVVVDIIRKPVTFIDIKEK